MTDERPIETHCPWCEGAGADARDERSRRYEDAEARGVLLTSRLCARHRAELRQRQRAARRGDGWGGA